MPNNEVITGYVAKVTNFNFDIWSPKCPWLDKEWSIGKLCTDIRGTKVLQICVTIPESQISFHFRVTGYFYEKYTKRPWNIRYDIAYMCLVCPYVPNLGLFCSMSSGFWVVGPGCRPFRDKCTKWPQISLHTTWYLMYVLLVKFRFILHVRRSQFFFSWNKEARVRFEPGTFPLKKNI